MSRIAQIIDPAFRTGVGKKGEWVLMKVQTDDGKQATIFAPAKEGDEVTLTYNDEYKNYNAQKVKPNLNSPAPSSDQLDRIENTVNQILFKMNGLKSLMSNETQPPITVEVDPDQPPVDQLEPPF